MLSEIKIATLDHLDEIDKLWGLDRATLGFMSRGAFIQAIKKRWILVSISQNKVEGYLQFRFTQKTQCLSIVHLCIDRKHRGKGISDLLINKLVENFRNQSRGIRLNCRTDYKNAIAFWTRYGFTPKGQLPSRGSDQSVHLITWWYSFGTLDLFSAITTDKVNAVLDFNIIAKMMEPDLDERTKQEILALQSDWLASEVEYFRTSETTNEIFRDQNTERRNRSKAFLKHFQELNIDKSIMPEFESELLKIYKGRTDNDQSDRRQITEAILSGFPYFVTLDEGILMHRKDVLEQFGISIVRPIDFVSEIDLTLNSIDYYPDKLSGNNFTIGKLVPSERESLENVFLSNQTGEKKTIFNQRVTNALAHQNGGVTVIKEKNENVAFFAYTDGDKFLEVSLLRTKQYRLRQTIFMQNITDLLKLTLAKNKQFLAITDEHLTPNEKQILLNFSFFEVDSKWIRAMGQGIYSLDKIGNELSDISNTIPPLSELIKKIGSANALDYYLNMFSLEKLLWPLKIKEADIPCFIVPIKPHFARELFDTKAAKGELWGVEPKLIWSKENVYYRNIAPDVEKFPARILWYSSASKFSSRQKAVVCSSYLDEVIVGPAKQLFKKHERYGIYSWEKHILPLAKNDANKPIKILRFSDSEAFDQPIALTQLKQILFQANESDNNFQSPLRIKNSTFMEIYALGKGIDYNHE
ncbi:GNAT family N-acetyltransferase [Pedobacter sp. KLB.chiD]|uniref:GNAT family N-acetyltransferase n=1 Tax=Pedobacter sp. KLB.chiD TaxID=3387402 RepID=UPI00399AF3A6